MIVILNNISYNIYVVKRNKMSLKVADKKFKTITRSIRFERKDWENLVSISIKNDLPISHLVRKAVREFIKNNID